jgi:hypothetical protein
VSRPDSDSIVVFYLGLNAKPLRREEMSVGKGAKGVAIADLDGDGRKDMAVTLQGASRLILLMRR